MRRVILLIPIALAALAACQPPAVARAPAGAVGQPPAAALPEPGVYVLQRVRGLALPADLKPPDYDPRRGGSFERLLGGWMYLTPDSSYDRSDPSHPYHLYHRYQTIICADLINSPGPGPNTMDRGPGEGAYWAAGGRVYFSLLVVDGPQDSTAVRIHGDTLEFVRQVYVRDRTAVRPRNLIPAYLCPAIRAAPARGPDPAPGWASLVAEVVGGTPQHDRIIPR